MVEKPKIYRNEEIPYEEPEVIEKAVNVFKRFPGIGDRTARRIIYWLLGTSRDTLNEFVDSLKNLSENIKTCSICYNISTSDPCYICKSPERDHSTICVVSEPQDLAAIETTRIYNGVYHILGGVLDPLKGIGPEQLHIEELIQRISSNDVDEVILALDPSNEGEITAKHLAKMLAPTGIKITILARGISSGSTLEFTDPKTLTNALINRKPL